MIQVHIGSNVSPVVPSNLNLKHWNWTMSVSISFLFHQLKYVLLCKNFNNISLTFRRSAGKLKCKPYLLKQFEHKNLELNYKHLPVVTSTHIYTTA